MIWLLIIIGLIPIFLFIYACCKVASESDQYMEERIYEELRDK